MKNTFNLINSECIAAMRAMPSNSVDSIVTDPPYELGFMGKKWDSSGIANSVEMWAEALRVLKPGGHLLAFSGSRTYHRMTCAIEDAGFEIRDQAMWLYGSGFPKSLDVSKALDKAAGAVREVIRIERHGTRDGSVTSGLSGGGGYRMGTEAKITSASTPEGQKWQGWGTALKPAHEPICVARKPLIGTVAQNVLVHGVGALNVDGCRVEGESTKRVQGEAEIGFHGGNFAPGLETGSDAGRWPANVMHDGSEEVEAVFPGEGEKSASRYFYSAKASRADRDAGMGAFATQITDIHARHYSRRMEDVVRADGKPPAIGKNTHPTVKPTALMRHLVRLVTPKGGTVLDPFMGSGSTGRAAMLEGMDFIGIDMTPEYVEIARARISMAHQDILRCAAMPQNLDLFGAQT